MLWFGYISNSIFMISTVLYRKQLRDEVKVLRIVCIFDSTALNYKKPSKFHGYFLLSGVDLIFLTHLPLKEDFRFIYSKKLEVKNFYQISKF